MAFWIAAIGLCLLVTAPVALAALRVRHRAGTGAGAGAGADTAIYRDQLRELDQDRARGVISEADAVQARIEISRRLLCADAAAGKIALSEAPATATRMMIAAAAVLVGGAGSLYLMLGAPGYPDLPLRERIGAAEEARASRPGQAVAEAEPASARSGATEEYQALVARLRRVVADRPDDLQGHVLLVQGEARLGNFAAAHAAQALVLALKGRVATADDWADHADLLILAAGGYVSPEAEQALTRALALDPANGVARYYSGLMFLQTGRPDLAFQLWATLLRESRPDAPWLPLIRARIEEVALRAGVQYTLPEPQAALPGPSAEEVSAAGELGTGDRARMIRSMVEGLAERLATEGGAAQEWARLVGALGVLGEVARARAIRAEAQIVFAGDANALALINSAAQNAGLIE